MFELQRLDNDVRLLIADQPDDIRAKAAAAVRSAFAKRPGDTAVQIDGAAWIVTARN